MNAPESVMCPMCGQVVTRKQMIECSDTQFQPYCRFRGATTSTDHLHAFCSNPAHLNGDRPSQGQFIVLLGRPVMAVP